MEPIMLVAICAIAAAVALLLIYVLKHARITLTRPFLRYNRLGTLVLYALPVLGLGGTVVLVLLRQYGFLALSIYLVIPMILGPGIYLAYRNRKPVDQSYGDRGFRLLLILYLLLFALSAFLLYAFEVRPFLYYVIVAGIATAVLLQILLFKPDRTKTGLILLQIAALTLNIIWGMSLKYYYFVGRTDILGHAWFVENILRYGHVTQAFEVYQPFALWHFLMSALYMISGTSLHVYTVMFIACGLVYALTTFAVYYVTDKVTGNVRIALLAALFMSFYHFFILQGTEPMPRSITGCLLIILIILFMGSKDRRYYPLVLILTLGVIMFHTVSIAFFLAILLMVYVTGKVFGGKDTFPMLDLKYFVIAGAMTAVYWGLFGGVLLEKLTYNINVEAPTGVITQSVIETPLYELFNYLQYMPFVLFIILGILLALRSSGIRRALCVFATTTLVLIPLTFPGPLLLLNKLNVNFGIDRFYENGYLFMGMAAAIGLYVIYSRAGKYMKTALVGIFAVLVILSLSNDFIATDNPLVKRPFYTHYLTESDIAGADHIRDMANTSVLADYPIVRYLMYNDYVQLPTLIWMDAKNNTLIESDPPSPMIFRKGELARRPLDILSVDDIQGPMFSYYVPWTRMTYFNESAPVWKDFANYSRIYDSNTMECYY
jgi:hypothetical protein